MEINKMTKAIEVDTKEYNLIKKSLDNPATRKMAIDAMCFQCNCGTYEDLPDPCWKKAIRHCDSPHCALWNFRPYV